MLDVDCLLFDVGGSIFDWETAIVEVLEHTGALGRAETDAKGFAESWRRHSMIHMYDIAAERVPWTRFDDFIDASLTDALDERSVGPIDGGDRLLLLEAWRRMPAWPEAADAIRRLRDRFVVAPHTILSLSSVALSSKSSGLTWDAIVSCDALGATKTNPESYRRAADAIGFDPHRVLYVAAHTSDLEVVRTLGMRTAYVHSRLDEYGESPLTGDAPERYDVLADDYADLADRLL